MKTVYISSNNILSPLGFTSKENIDQIIKEKSGITLQNIIGKTPSYAALIINDTDIPMVLVGDSASMVVYGYNNTMPITMEELLLITKSVKRGINKALIIYALYFENSSAFSYYFR